LASNNNNKALRRRWAARAGAAALAVGSLALTSAGLSAAQAAPATTRTTATVVKVVTRMPVGKMLATIKGRSLYIKPKGGCTGACLVSWPPLLMPKGTNMPRGVRCLGTAKRGIRLQVTYRGKRLYKFAGDSGTSLNGNGLSGFKAAKLISGPCP
jgi:predicted lipoprotein with Yx(FWY)xxD motif